MVKRHTTYCFEAKMKEIGKDTYYFVPFQVLAENQYVAKTILEEYLKKPEQTGWRYEVCVNLMPMPTKQIVIDTNKTSDVLNSKNLGSILKAKNCELPTADVVEVVRCKDCTEWDKDEYECSHWYGFREDDFCSYGERMDGECKFYKNKE